MVELTGYSVFSGDGISLSIEHDRVINVNQVDVSRDAPIISPGFVDLQVNGFAGYDYTSENFSSEHLQRLVHLLAASGTTRHIPTIITSPQKRIVKNLQIISRTLKNSPDLAAAIPGVHIEGPYISHEDGPRGAHNPKFIRESSLSEFSEWQEAADGRVKIVTVAPEKRGALDFISQVSRLGVIVAIGHTAASPEQIRDAVEAGATLSTHLGNGSHRDLPRLHNYLWEQLAEDRLYAGIIADGFHLPPSVLKVFARSKGLERLILVSDIAAAGGQAPGVYEWGDIKVEVHADGHIRLAGSEFLAGASHLLNRDIAQFMRHTGLGLAEVISLCTINAAKVLGGDWYANSLERGMPADLTLFHYRPGDEQLQIVRTLLRGETIYRR